MREDDGIRFRHMLDAAREVAGFLVDGPVLISIMIAN